VAKPQFPLKLWLRNGRGKVASSYRAIEANTFVGAIAEGQVAGMAAAAKANSFTSRKTEGLAFLVDNFEIAFDTYGTVVGNSNFSNSQGKPPKNQET
jgi:hypothetical protein